MEAYCKGITLAFRTFPCSSRPYFDSTYHPKVGCIRKAYLVLSGSHMVVFLPKIHMAGDKNSAKARNSRDRERRRKKRCANELRKEMNQLSLCFSL